MLCQNAFNRSESGKCRVVRSGSASDSRSGSGSGSESDGEEQQERNVSRSLVQGCHRLREARAGQETASRARSDLFGLTQIKMKL